MTITPDGTLAGQAWQTADSYLGRAIECIDDRLGPGYARSHPALVAAFMQTAMTDRGVSGIVYVLETCLAQVEDRLATIGRTVQQIAEIAEQRQL
jgi:hypothetical protein